MLRLQVWIEDGATAKTAASATAAAASSSANATPTPVPVAPLVRRWEGSRATLTRQRMLTNLLSPSSLASARLSVWASKSAAGECWKRIDDEEAWASFSADTAIIKVKVVMETDAAGSAASSAASVARVRPAAHSMRGHVTRQQFKGNWKAASAARLQARAPLQYPVVITERKDSELEDWVQVAEDDEEWESGPEGVVAATKPSSSAASSSSSSKAAARSRLPFPPALRARMLAPPPIAREDGSSTITFTVNGTEIVLENPDPQLLLAPFLRENLMLTGTKIGCGEGGCGACTVMLAFTDPVSGATKQVSTNSCLHLVAQLDGMSVTTIEGLGSERTGLHPIQSSMVQAAATQCGYCSGGFAMSMYGLLQNESAPTTQMIEDRFDGNLCRCTGYRSILAAMRAVAPTPAGEEKHGGCASGGCKCGSKGCGSASSSSSCSSSSSSSCAPASSLKQCGKGSGASCSLSAKSACHAVGIGCGSQKGAACVSADVEDLAGKFDRSNPKHLLPVVLPASAANGPVARWTSTATSLFITPTNVADVSTILAFYAASSTPLRLVVGNTSIGVANYYAPAIPNAQVLVNLASLPELLQVSVADGGLKVGASVTIQGLIDALQSSLSTQPASATAAWPALIRHLSIMASHGIRNVGSWAGNLMIAKSFTAFPSDPLTVLSAARANLTLFSNSAGTRSFAVTQLQSTAFLADELITSLTIPFSTANQSFDSYKTRARHQMAHPIVNLAALITLSGSTDPSGAPIINDATLAIGGLPCSAAQGVFLAPKTSGMLSGMPLTAATMSEALTALSAEITPTAAQVATWRSLSPDVVLTDPAFPQSLAMSLLYKFFLTRLAAVPGFAMPPRDVSAYEHYARAISSGAESFTPDPATAPLGQPVPKIESAIQVTGEALYTNDEVMSVNGLYAALAYSKQATGTITAIDASVALQQPGVVRFISAQDLATINAINDCGAFPGDEEVFATNTVTTWGQSIGLILADTQYHATAAAKLVEVSYAANPPTPIVSLSDAIAAKSFFPDNAYQQNPPPLVRGDIVAGFAASAHVVSASHFSGGQSHFALETQSAYAVPGERGVMDVYSASQGAQNVRQMVSHCLNVPANRIVAHTKRCGGAYGSKLTRNVPLACAVSIAAALTGRPIKAQCERGANEIMWGKRPEFRIDYKVGFNNDGRIIALDMTFYQQGGHTYENNLGTLGMAIMWSDNTYWLPNVSCAGFVCKTNTPSNTSMRGPGVIKSIWNIEMIMERIAFELGMSPDAVRQANFYTEGQLTPYLEPVTNITLPACWNALVAQANYVQKKADAAAFNAANRWRKRGVHISTVKYGITDSGQYNQDSLQLGVCMEDGSLQLSHSGVEMGQGINTKVLQSLCFELSTGLGVALTMDNFRMGDNNTAVVCNGSMTGGSSTSEACCAAAVLAAAELVSRLKPVQAANPSITTWAALIAAAELAQVNLQISTQYMTPNAPADAQFSYFVFAAACSQVELDTLTGEYQVLAVDIVYDCGNSLSPLVDIGQIEGGFLMGLGHALIEEAVYSPTTGELVTKGSFDYHIPSSQDIPIQFNVSLLAGVPNKAGILNSKATAEPPVMLATSAFCALRDCITAARTEAGLSGWFDLPTPATTARVQAACGTTPAALVL